MYHVCINCISDLVIIYVLVQIVNVNVIFNNKLAKLLTLFTLI